MLPEQALPSLDCPAIAPRKVFSGSFLLLACATAVALVLSFLRWELIGLLTIFLEPMVEIVVWSFYLATLVAVIVRAISARNRSRSFRFSPLILAVGSLCVFYFVPFTEIVLKVDFHRHLEARTLVAERVLRDTPNAKPTRPDVPDFVSLNGSEKRLSDDGELAVYHAGGKKLVLFFTFRGVLDHFSGFVYSPNDIPPSREDIGVRRIEVEHLRKNWYWLASS